MENSDEKHEKTPLELNDMNGDSRTNVLENDVNASEENRETWGHKIEFVLTCVGYCVGLGNVWRFPYLAFNNGGGAFLIPYFTMLILCGMPLFLMELALGQYFSLGPVSTWNAACPIGKGIGIAMIVVAFLCTIYYNVIVAWVLYYMYLSVGKDVPWKTCGNSWNTPQCMAASTESDRWNCNSTSTLIRNASAVFTKTVRNFGNGTICTRLDIKSPSEEYWERFVLQITENIEQSGSVRPELLICLIFAWALVFLCLCKGIKSSGKVVYFTATFPYVVMFILLIRGCILEGAGTGIEFYLKPDFKKLGKAEVWVAAATQIFYSLGIGFGSLIAFGSYNKFHNNVIRDAVSLSLVNCFTSVFAGIVVFSVLGHMSFKTGMPIEDVAASGPGLVFVVYPEGLSQMPISPLWGILFFFMILTIGLDTQFAMLEAVIVGFIDEYKFLEKKKMLFTLSICIISCLLGISMVTQGGMYVLNVFNTQAGGVSLLFLAFFEVVVVAYGYGAERFERNLRSIMGRRILPWWRWCWKYFSPCIIAAIFISSLVQWSGIKYNGVKTRTTGEVLGWFLALLSMLWIPAIAIYKYIKEEGTFLERIKKLSSPNQELLQKIADRHNLKEFMDDENDIPKV